MGKRAASQAGKTSWGDVDSDSDSECHVCDAASFADETFGHGCDDDSCAHTNVDAEKAHAGESLVELLFQLYSLGKLDAQSLCVATYWSVKSGAQGELLERLAFAPGKQSGSYARHLRRMIPHQVGAPELHWIDMPCWQKIRGAPRGCLWHLCMNF